jgi:hypothetical protein
MHVGMLGEEVAGIVCTTGCIRVSTKLLYKNVVTGIGMEKMNERVGGFPLSV